MEIVLQEYREDDLPAFQTLWNHIIEDGVAYPGEELLSEAQVAEMLSLQTKTVCAFSGDRLVGLYIIHPNNIGRCSHVANASYGVARDCRGMGIGHKLVPHSLELAKKCGFRGMQFNAVVASNHAAIALYKKYGFENVGTIPGGFRLKDETYSDMHIMYCGL